MKNQTHFISRLIFGIWLLMPAYINTLSQTNNNDTINCNINAQTHQFNELALLCKFYVIKPFKTNLVFWDDWNFGTVTLTDGNTVRNIYLRYDRLDDQLIWMRENDFKMGTIEKELVKEWWITQKSTGDTVRFVKLDNLLLGVKSSYVRILVQANTSLFIQYKLAVNPNNNETSLQETYFVSQQGQYKSFGLRRLSLLKAMGDRKKEMRSILNKNNLTISQNENHLIKAFEIYNQMHP